MKNCTALYNSKKIQTILKTSFQKRAAQMIQEQGGLPEYFWRDYKKGFKSGFIKSCKAMKKNKSKSRKNAKNN
jgi:hypothetical protein